jgi:hypothetical protein
MKSITAPSIAGVILLSVLLLYADAGAQEKTIRKKDVPAAVISAFQKAYPDAKMKGFAAETEHGTLYYEVESVRGKQTVDALLLPDGTFYEIEEAMTAKDLPAAVSGAVKAKHPKAKFQKAEKVTRGTEISYDLSATEGKSKISLTIDPNGKILKEATKELKKEQKEKAEEEQEVN